MQSTQTQKFLGMGCLCILVILAFWLRIQTVPAMPHGQFTETDAYLFHWHAQLIAEAGHLPERDMHRWLPLGRDLTQSLNLYAYVLAYTHKTVSKVFSAVSLYAVSLYAPAVCFCLTLAALGVFLALTRGWTIALSVCLILATLPGAIERSSAGFSDRDAWCLMLGTFALTTYLTALNAALPRQRLLWRTASGLLMFLGGLSWEAFGVFLAIIIGVELWRFLTAQTDTDLPDYLLWVCLFVPPLWLASPAYRGGHGFTTHIDTFMLVPALMLAALRGIRYLIQRKIPTTHRYAPYMCHVTFALTLVTGDAAGGYLLLQQEELTLLTVSFVPEALWETIGELKPPHFGYWIYRYSSVFLTGSIGLIVMPWVKWGRPARLLVFALGAFTILAFFRNPLAELWGQSFGNALFAVALSASCFRGLQLAWHRTTNPRPSQNEHTTLAMILWALIWITLARDAKRHDFFIGIPLAFFTAELIRYLAARFSDLLQNPKYTTDALRQILPQTALKNGVAITLLGLALIWGPEGGHLLRAHAAATPLRSASPGKDTDIARALNYMKTHLPPTAIVAAEWSFGTQLNVLAGVKTITDSDHYLPHWIHLYHQHVRLASDENVALTFLKTHGATHLMITEKQPQNTLLRGRLSGAFQPIYPPSDFENAAIKLWQIQYPPHIQTDPKHLQTTHPGEQTH